MKKFIAVVCWRVTAGGLYVISYINPDEIKEVKRIAMNPAERAECFTSSYLGRP